MNKWINMHSSFYMLIHPKSSHLLNINQIMNPFFDQINIVFLPEFHFSKFENEEINILEKMNPNCSASSIAQFAVDS